MPETGPTSEEDPIEMEIQLNDQLSHPGEAGGIGGSNATENILNDQRLRNFNLKVLWISDNNTWENLKYIR